MGKIIVIKSDTGRSYDIFIYCSWVILWYIYLLQLGDLVIYLFTAIGFPPSGSGR